MLFALATISIDEMDDVYVYIFEGGEPGRDKS